MSSSDRPALSRPLNLAEYFLLLAVDQSGRTRIDGHTVLMGLAGATLADLARRGHLKVTQDVITVNQNPEDELDPEWVPSAWLKGRHGLEEPLQKVLELIEAAPHTQDAEQWVNRFARPALRDAVLHQLQDLELVRVKHSKLLGLFDRTRYLKHTEYLEMDLQVRLTRAMSGDEPADYVTWPLVALARTTGLLGVLYPDTRKDLTRELNPDSTNLPVGNQAISVAETLQAVENAVAESLVATRGGASSLKSSR